MQAQMKAQTWKHPNQTKEPPEKRGGQLEDFFKKWWGHFSPMGPPFHHHTPSQAKKTPKDFKETAAAIV